MIPRDFLTGKHFRSHFGTIVISDSSFYVCREVTDTPSLLEPGIKLFNVQSSGFLFRKVGITAPS